MSRGAKQRLRAIAESTGPLSLDAIAPAVHTYVCWTGGYVQPFLDRLAIELPAPRYRLLPMYSMSTETPETTPIYRGDCVSFVPMARGVLYEFLEAGAPDSAARLLEPHQLDIGKEYAMVVSDEYGLTRYQTEDVFTCVGHVSSLPDLRFVRRRSLSYSFTGEKLTAEQVSEALGQVRLRHSALAAACFLTCVPSVAASRSLPCYLLVGVSRDGVASPSFDAAAAQFDDALCALNSEYAAKRRSGRLGAIRGVASTREAFLSRMAPGRNASWEAQFKFLPLYRAIWEEGSGIRADVAMRQEASP